MGHSDEGRRFSEGDHSSDNNDYSLLLESFVVVRDGMAPEGPTPMVAEEKRGGGGCHPRLGPWLETFRIQQPRTPRVTAKGRRDSDVEKSPCPDLSDPNSSPSSRRSPRVFPSSPSSLPNSDDWQKPTKVAHRRPLGVGPGFPPEMVLLQHRPLGL